MHPPVPNLEIRKTVKEKQDLNCTVRSKSMEDIQTLPLFHLNLDRSFSKINNNGKILHMLQATSCGAEEKCPKLSVIKN